jgi:nucleotide-binding universal stress UspA family protein
MAYRILVTTDTGDKSKASAIYALKLAKAVGGSVTVMYVNDSTNYVNNLACGAPGIRGENALGWIADKGSEFGMTVRTMTVDGIPADEIIRKTSDFDILVMGTAGREGVAHLLLGSVTEKVIRYSKCPVIAVRNLDPDAPFRMEKMLIATDGSDYTAPAVRGGLEMAKVTPGVTKITALSVFDNKTMSRASGNADTEAACERAVSYVHEEGSKLGLEVEKKIVPGSPSQIIGGMSAYYDMVVMGTMGRTGWKRLSMGSVAEKTVREVNCPVMVVRYRKQEDLPESR